MDSVAKNEKTAFDHVAPRATLPIYWIVILWTILVGGSFCCDFYVVWTSVKEMAFVQAHSLYEKDLLYRRWSARHGGVYVPVTPETPPNPYLEKVGVKDLLVTTPSGRLLTLMNPAYMSRQILEQQEADFKIKGHLASLKPIYPGNTADKWERAALLSFEKGVKSAVSVETVDGRDHLRVMYPFKTEQPCLRCHAQQGYGIGDVRGGISVSVPMAPYIAMRNSYISTLLATHASVWLLGGIGIFLGLRKYQQSERLRAAAEVQLRQQHVDLENAYVELKATQSSFLQQEKMASIGQLAAGVAHEINNPLGFIHSNLGTLSKYLERIKGYLAAQDAALLGNAQEETLTALAESRKKLKIDHILTDIPQLIAESSDGAGRVRDIVQNLKTFSRIDNVGVKQVNLNDCLESTINIANNEIKYKATLIKEFGTIPPVSCHPQQLNQVFLNLLVNAAHAIETSGEITVRTWQEAGDVCIAISDTGCGIPEAIRSRIFEPFFTTKEVGRGTGLGLSISYDIVKKHGGELSVASEIGKGSTFTVKVPVQGPQADTQIVSGQMNEGGESND